MRNALALVLVAAVSLAGCSSATVGITPSPEPTAGLSVPTQRAEAQTGIAVAETIQAASLLAIVIDSIAAGVHTARRASATCKDGVETTVTPVSPEQFTIAIGVFYDTTCKAPLALAVLDATLFLPSNLSIAGTATFYETNGKAVAYGRLANKTTLGTSSSHAVTTGSIAKTPKGAAVLSFGLTCTLAKVNDCGFGGIAPVASLHQSFGVASTLKGFTTSGTVKNGSATVLAYQGGLSALSLAQGSGDAWTISGGTLVASPSGPFDESVDASSLNVRGRLNLADDVNGAGVALSYGNRTGIAHGTVSTLDPVNPFSSFSTDAAGTGAIAYSEGAGELIRLFVVIAS